MWYTVYDTHCIRMWLYLYHTYTCKYHRPVNKVSVRVCACEYVWVNFCLCACKYMYV